LGIGDWGLWVLGCGANPQTPTPKHKTQKKILFN